LDDALEFDGATTRTSGGTVTFAWLVGAIGLAAGLAGGVLLASDPRSAPKAARIARHAWLEQVSAAARDTLAVLRRLASGITPGESDAVRADLSRCARRFRELRAAMPAHAEETFAAVLDAAATGADIEATRLSGVAVMHGDRRAFLDALRTLRSARDLEGRTNPKNVSVSSSAGADVASSFTVA
jgi:hypothetical protein